MKTTIKLFALSIFMILAESLSAQSYYVNTKTLNLRSDEGLQSEIIGELSYCDNVTLVADSLTTDWVKIEFRGSTVYVSREYINEGTCHKNLYTYRVGAVCRDGSSSSATGRGACSHHGGVSRWKTQEKTDYMISNNQE
ncbi:SH3 domain-containing protein [Fulvivirga sediminis]|uniref:SH3 domain-containing protein n=1 Tax=Fulvivirga sediminis TaxID=2803949 RepID=A0A937K1J0_9BACT|nr:SH3 domain-containing protein [Fulvivirga sediminis]MBL3657385.1 SH3 domain-containing protein [Fulvivirga sediminis]